MYLNVLLKPGKSQKGEITEQISKFTEKVSSATVNLLGFYKKYFCIYPGCSEQSAGLQQSAIRYQIGTVP